MHLFLTIAGLAWLAWSFMIFGVAKGGIHEVYGAILASSGVLFLGLGALLRQLKAIADRPHASERM